MDHWKLRSSAILQGSFLASNNSPESRDPKPASVRSRGCVWFITLVWSGENDGKQDRQ